jgi:RES domain-containing protein
VYLAESPAGALVEALIHLELLPNAYPSHYGLLKTEVSERVSIRGLEIGDLSRNWFSDVVATRTIGDEWLASRNTLLLRVPSAIVPETWNVLLNPEHADVAQVRILWHKEHPWDLRFFSQAGGRS